MTEFQRLFLVQARTDFEVFELLRKQERLTTCHILHYLQMATEMLGKAHAWKTGPKTTTHRAFASFLKSLGTNRKAQKQLGFEGHNANWENIIRKCGTLAERIEDLAPALSPDLPNSEYPWPRVAPTTPPVEYKFAIWIELQETALGRQLLSITKRLFAAAEAYL